MAQSPFFSRHASLFAAGAPTERLPVHQNLIRKSTAFFHLCRAARSERGAGLFVPFFTRSLTTRNAGRREAIAAINPLRISRPPATG
jgi:hypothetical protein